MTFTIFCRRVRKRTYLRFYILGIDNDTKTGQTSRMGSRNILDPATCVDKTMMFMPWLKSFPYIHNTVVAIRSWPFYWPYTAVCTSWCLVKVLIIPSRLIRLVVSVAKIFWIRPPVWYPNVNAVTTTYREVAVQHWAFYWTYTAVCWLMPGDPPAGRDLRCLLRVWPIRRAP